MLESLIKELKTKFKFKQSTNTNDLVIILSKGFGIVPNQISFGIVKNIIPGKNKSYKIEILLLAPLRLIAFNLIKDFYTGKQFFYVDGCEMWISAIKGIADDNEEDEKKSNLFTLIHGGCSEKDNNGKI